MNIKEHHGVHSEGIPTLRFRSLLIINMRGEMLYEHIAYSKKLKGR